MNSLPFVKSISVIELVTVIQFYASNMCFHYRDTATVIKGSNALNKREAISVCAGIVHFYGVDMEM